jgi:hypothetical protein
MAIVDTITAESIESSTERFCVSPDAQAVLVHRHVQKGFVPS